MKNSNKIFKGRGLNLISFFFITSFLWIINPLNLLKKERFTLLSRNEISYTLSLHNCNLLVLEKASSERTEKVSLETRLFRNTASELRGKGRWRKEGRKFDDFHIELPLSLEDVSSRFVVGNNGYAKLGLFDLWRGGNANYAAHSWQSVQFLLFRRNPVK